MAFWTMSRFAMRSGAMFTAASVMNKVSRMGGHVHDKDVADAPAGAKARLSLGDGPKQLIRMQASLHQQFGFARANELNGLLRRRLAVRGIDDLEAVDVEAERFRDVG